MAKFLTVALGKHILKGSPISLGRVYSSNAKLLNTVMDNNTGIAMISMNKQPVNSLNLDFVNELTHQMRELEKNECQGVILTSELPMIFSGGIDYTEIYKPDAKRIAIMWHSVQEFWLTLYGLKLPIAAAINGACYGAACLFALSCEYRVFVEGKHRIGLNETKLGFIAPQWAQNVLVDTIGYRQAEISLLQGSLYKPEEALKIGLVDELATDKTDAIAKCEKYIASYANIPPEARSAAKVQLRRATISWLNKNREFDSNTFIDLVKKPQVQTKLGAYIKSMRKK